MRILFVYSTAFLLLNSLVLPFQSQAQDFSRVESARLPLPVDLRAEATILHANESGTFDTLHEGGNGFFCIADKPDDDRLSLECHPETLRAYRARQQYLVHTESKAVRDSLLKHELQSEKWPLPVGALSYYLSGRVNKQTGSPDSIWVWSEIAVPFVGPSETGLSTENQGAAPWLMNEKEYDAHIMIGYEFVPWIDFIADDAHPRETDGMR